MCIGNRPLPLLITRMHIISKAHGAAHGLNKNVPVLEYAARHPKSLLATKSVSQVPRCSEDVCALKSSGSSVNRHFPSENCYLDIPHTRTSYQLAEMSLIYFTHIPWNPDIFMHNILLFIIFVGTVFYFCHFLGALDKKSPPSDLNGLWRERSGKAAAIP